MSYSSYQDLYLEEISFIAGHNFVINFDIFDEDGNEVSLLGKTCLLTMCRYGQPEYVYLTKTGSISVLDTNRFTITFAKDDTKTLEASKYIYQIIIREVGGLEYRPKQGIITLSAAIQN